MNDVTEATFEESVLKADGPVLVDFWAPGKPGRRASGGPDAFPRLSPWLRAL